MPRIPLHNLGTPIFTTNVPAIPPGSYPGEIIFKNPFPALPAGSAPGTVLDIMTLTAAKEFSRIMQKPAKK
jgi:hypothetical protein